MAINKSLAAWTCVALLVMTTDVVAQNGKSTTNQGSTPNGKPFQQIQSQFVQLTQRMQALETHASQISAHTSHVRGW